MTIEDYDEVRRLMQEHEDDVRARIAARNRRALIARAGVVAVAASGAWRFLQLVVW